MRLKSLYSTMRTLFEQIAKPGTFLVSATRLGGQHGYDEAGRRRSTGWRGHGIHQDLQTGTARSARSRQLTSESMPLQKNSPNYCSMKLSAIPARLRSATRMDCVGRSAEEQSAADGRTGLTLDENTVFVITGAAGSIVSAITADLAAASGGTFYLLDLVPEPDPDILTSSALSPTKTA